MKKRKKKKEEDRNQKQISAMEQLKETGITNKGIYVIDSAVQ